MSKKNLGIIGCVATAVIVVVVILLLILGRDKSYRVIKVLQINGTATVERDSAGVLDVYEGMALENGDTLSVDANSMVVLQLDGDKYGYVEENTLLNMVAEGDEGDNKTIIELERGAITCHLENTLSESSSYEVHTQDSVMTVRGTVFRVEYILGLQMNNRFNVSDLPVSLQNEIGDGSIADGYTRTSVFEGTVAATLLNPDGTTGKTSMLIAGREAWVGGTATNSYFMEESTSIRRNLLPLQSLNSLLQISDNGGDLLMEDNEITQLQHDINSLETHMMYFYVGDTLFGMQEVDHGTLPEEPSLRPDESGSWNINFRTSIMDDTYVYWVEE